MSWTPEKRAAYSQRFGPLLRSLGAKRSRIAERTPFVFTEAHRAALRAAQKRRRQRERETAA